MQRLSTCEKGEVEAEDLVKKKKRKVDTATNKSQVSKSVYR